MKSYYYLSIALLTLPACQKVAPKPATGPSELLSKIINNTVGKPGFGKAFLEFTYKGKQLTTDVEYAYKSDGSVDNTRTTTFNYDGSGNFISTTIVDSNPSYHAFTGATITALNNNISEIKLYQPGNVLYDDVKLFYQGSLLSVTTSPLSNTFNYNYNSDGNNTQGYGQGVVNTTFDTANTLSSTLPFWVYLVYVRLSDGYQNGVPLYPGNHNIAKFTDGALNGLYSYMYDSQHYPTSSTETFVGNTTTVSYQYQYIPNN